MVLNLNPHILAISLGFSNLLLMKPILSFLILFFSANIVAQIPEPTVDFSSCNFQAIGHRGYSSVYPENTLLALEEAFKRGIKICEIDVQVTTDDVYVLFHDSDALHRTSSGMGNIDSSSFDDLLQLDFGSWKGEHFLNQQIATLEEALLLAQKYDAQLYLDTKTFRPDLMFNAIKATGVDDDRLMPSINDSIDIENYLTLLPNSPWVWYKGGLFPENVDSLEFFQNSVNKNCVAFEVTSFRVNDERWDAFERNVHAVGAKTWVFTENNNNLSFIISTQGVDAIESDRAWEITDFICNNQVRNFPDSITRGNWRFTNGLNNAVGQGSQLRLANYRNPNPLFEPLFGRCNQFSIAPLSTENDSVMYVPKQEFNGGLFVYTNSLPESFGTEDEHYTIIMDVLFPESSLGNWISILQTNTLNLNDAELFISPSNQIGISEQYFGKIDANTWYRIAVTVNITDGFMRLYLDGELQGEIPIESNRWAVLNSSVSGERQGFLLFADDNDETQALYMASLQFRDYELDSTSIKNLGIVTNKGIKPGNADLWNVSLPNVSITNEILDYDNFNHHIWLTDPDIGNQVIDFQVSKDATASPVSGSLLDWSQGMQSISVTSSDGSMAKKWNVILHQSTVGIEDIDENNLTLYPNPSHDYVFISLDKNISGQLTLSTIDGKIVKTLPFNNGSHLLSVKALHDAYYIVKITTKDFSVSKKLLKY